MLVVLMVFAAWGYSSFKTEANRASAAESMFALYTLRDKLRMYAIDHPEPARNWLFPYLDSTICRSIRLLPNMTIFSIMSLLVSLDTDRFIQFNQQLRRELDKPSNEFYANLFGDYVLIMVEHLSKRHPMAFKVWALASRVSQQARKLYGQSQNLLLRTLLEAPEHPGSLRFVG